MIGAILAGGANTRYPTPKTFIEVGGRPIIERTIELMQRAIGEVVISTNEPERYFRYGLPMVGDVIKGSGPMAGILSVFSATGAQEVFVAACDMPYIKEELVKYIIDSKGGMAAVPVFSGRPEPLLAVYDRRAVPVMETLLSEGNRSMGALIERLDARLLPEEDIRRIDPEGRSFENINTLGDYDRIRGLRVP
jgi:molybdopterin-guanine dinucleotide biosynthesis protein A